MPGLLKSWFLRFLNRFIRRNRLITFLIFGVRLPSCHRVGWDFTTIALKNCLLRYVNNTSRVLEIGTGSYAILSLFIAKHRTCEITATELHESYIASSRLTAELNRLKLNLVVSDMFSNVNGNFDLIFWNSAYIPRHIGVAIGMKNMADVETDWCGGDMGTEEIARFLHDSASHLLPGGKILLGYNPVYLGTAMVEEVCGRNGYVVKKTHGAFLNPCKVIVLERTGT